MHEKHKENKKSIDSGDMNFTTHNSDIQSINRDVLKLEMGKDLTPLFQDVAFINKLTGIRDTIAKEFGIIIPSIQLSISEDLEDNEYRLNIKDIEVFSNFIEINKLLALPTTENDTLENAIPTKEPIFNMDAHWIVKEDEKEASEKNYAVIDNGSLIVSHTMYEINNHLVDIITRQDIYSLIQEVKQTHPIIVQDVLKNVSYGIITTIIKRLLDERVPVTNLITILEVISDVTEHTMNISRITERVRESLYREITNKYKNDDKKLNLLVFDPQTEEFLMDKIGNDKEINNKIEISDLRKLFESVAATLNENSGKSNLLLTVDSSIRRPLFELFKQLNTHIDICSHTELDKNVDFEIVSSIKI